MNATWLDGRRDRFGEMAAIEALRVAEEDGTAIFDQDGRQVRLVSGAFDDTAGSSAGTRLERRDENGEWVEVEFDDITLETREDVGGNAGANQGAIIVKIEQGHTTGAVAANPDPSAEGSEADPVEVQKERDKVDDKAGEGEKSVWAPVPEKQVDEEGGHPWFPILL